MTSARVPWSALPADVRAEVEAALGAPVVEAVNQPGGYSPSVAARCRLGDGRRVFIKAAAPELNPRTPEMLRDEVEVNRRLPPELPVPRLRQVVDDGTWVVAVFDDIDGRPPATPWTAAELAHVLAAVEAWAEAFDPSPIDHVPPIGVRHADTFGKWRALVAGDPTDVDGWAASNLDRMAALEATWEEAAAGDALLHCDIRADNLLIDRDGVVWLVDWPHASLGARWVDLLLMLPSVAHEGGPEPEEVWSSSRLSEEADPDAVTAVVAALDGYFTYQSRQPDPPGLPYVRAAQAAFGRVTRRWLRTRTGW